MRRRAPSKARDVMGILRTYTRLEAVEDLSYPMSLAFEQVGKVFPVILYLFVARLVDGRGGGHDVGGDYYTFAAIGLSVAVVMQAALSGFGRRLERAQNQGTFETLLVEPVPWTFIPIAMNAWRTALGFFNAAVMLVIAFALGARFDPSGLPVFVGILLLGAMAGTAVGAVSASLMVLAKRSQVVLALYGLAASLLGGALFPIEVMPGWLRSLSYLIPHMYVISAARAVLMPQPPAGGVNVSESVLVLATFNLVVFTVGLLLFSRALQYARKLGTLSGY